MKQTIAVLMFAASAALPITVAHSQSTTLKLPTAANTSDFTITDSAGTVLMKIFGDGGFTVFGNILSGVIPASGGGARMMWYPMQRAFRVGFANSTEWDDSNIGSWSTAMGLQTVASGGASFAAGGSATASGFVSTALGYSTVASGNYSIAAGYQDTASGLGATALGYLTAAKGFEATTAGYQTTATGGASTAMGYQNSASDYSTALGSNTTASFYSTAAGYVASATSQGTALGSFVTASGNQSSALGSNVVASGDYSVAVGYQVSTNGQKGAFAFGDMSTSYTTNSSAANEMTMRFNGGYRLFSKSDLSTGVTLSSGGGSWSSVSDSTKKANYLHADGEYFLQSLSRLKLGSWNYKTQDPEHFRHYGPMAQEIFRFFGKDAYGTIGNDTTLASADMDGIIMICLQALERRTTELREASQRMTQLEHLVSEQQSKLSAQQIALDELRRSVEGMINRGKTEAVHTKETKGQRQ